MPTLYYVRVPANAISGRHVEVPEETPALGLNGMSVQGAWKGKGRGFGGWKEDGALDGFCGRMEDEGSVTIISAALVATRSTLATDGAFLITLQHNGRQEKHTEIDQEFVLTPFFLRRQVLQPLLLPGTPTMTITHFHGWRANGSSQWG